MPAQGAVTLVKASPPVQIGPGAFCVCGVMPNTHYNVEILNDDGSLRHKKTATSGDDGCLELHSISDNALRLR